MTCNGTKIPPATTNWRVVHETNVETDVVETVPFCDKVDQWQIGDYQNAPVSWSQSGQVGFCSSIQCSGKSILIAACLALYLYTGFYA
jgi:hypothetical protein